MARVSAAALVLSVLAAQPAQTAAVNRRHNDGTLATLEMHMHRADCGMSRGRTSRRAKIPGAGMDPASITPFDKVLKDGYYEVTCVKDYMFTYGDKFHDNMFEYNMQQISNVSIVHYDSFVAHEDREPMTHEVCFRFCRSIPDMSFFGLQNGRMCYCTPYYKPMESDSTMCDAVCPGNPVTMCGGKTKSSIFGMHQCADTAADLQETSGKMVDVDGDMMALQSSADTASKAMQSAADEYQAMFGKAGDPVASDLMQSAKVFAGELEEAAGKAKTLSETVGTLKSEGEGMASADFSESSAVSKAEDTMESMEETTAQAEAAAEGLQKLVAAAAPDLADAEDASKLYYPVMYFVDKEFADMPSTCGGQAAEKPMVGSMDKCARACDADLHECVGFSFFPTAGSLENGEGLCFLMKKLTSATYYTKCEAGPAGASAASGPATQGGADGGGKLRGGFLQTTEVQRRMEDTSAVKCVAKFSEFEGTTLKPNPSGKCEICLKEVTKADRCFA